MKEIKSTFVQDPLPVPGEILVYFRDYEGDVMRLAASEAKGAPVYLAEGRGVYMTREDVIAFANAMLEAVEHGN